MLKADLFIRLKNNQLDSVNNTLFFFYEEHMAVKFIEKKLEKKQTPSSN
jgi:hypothetical protein